MNESSKIASKFANKWKHSAKSSNSTNLKMDELEVTNDSKDENKSKGKYLISR